MKEFFYLKDYVRITDGYKSSLICNLFNNKMYKISNKLSLLLQSLDRGELISSLCGGNQEVLNTLKYLEDKEIGFFSDVFQDKKLAKHKFSNEIGMLWINVTSKCNYKCLHCYEESAPTVSVKDNLLISQYQKTLKILNGKYGIKAIQIIGGEPLIRGKKFIFDLLDVFNQEKIPFIEVYSNCSLIDEEYCNFFKANNVRVATSIYASTAKKHDEITQVKGSFETLIKKIKMIQQYDIPIRVSAVIMEQNKSEIASLKAFILNGLKIKDYKIDVIRPIGRGRCKNVMPINLFYIRHSKTYDKIVRQSISRYDYNKSFQSCWGDKLCIDSSGNIYPCIMSAYKVGTINEVEHVWTGENSYRSITNDKIEVCKDCEFRYICLDCKAMSEQCGVFSKPYYCAYDPYEGKWNEPNKIFFENEVLK